jgi:hypothetical protein
VLLLLLLLLHALLVCPVIMHALKIAGPYAKVGQDLAVQLDYGPVALECLDALEAPSNDGSTILFGRSFRRRLNVDSVFACLQNHV